MKITDIISLDNIFVDLEVSSKKALFKEIASIIEKKSAIKQSLVLDNLNKREQLGSTAIGDGIAIPHSKVKGLKKIFSLFIRLKESVDFSAADLKKIDIIFVIIAPEESKTDHLMALSEISNFLRIKGNKEKLRKLKSIDSIYEVFFNFNAD